MTIDPYITLSAISGAIVRELFHYDKHVDEFKSNAAYFRDRIDNIAITFICAFWLVQGAPYFWAWVLTPGWHNILTAFPIGLLGYSLSEFAVNKIWPTLEYLYEWAKSFLPKPNQNTDTNNDT